jgi:hypothetical protein
MAVFRRGARVGCRVRLRGQSDRDRRETAAVDRAIVAGGFSGGGTRPLPPAQRDTRVGVLTNAAAFATVWEALRPDEAVPTVDFGKHIVVFSRNVQFYNRTSIAKVTLRDGVAEIIAIETMSAAPIEDKVAMALAVIPRQGVVFIEAGERRIAVDG